VVGDFLIAIIDAVEHTYGKFAILKGTFHPARTGVYVVLDFI
jgi:hypothetical protein